MPTVTRLDRAIHMAIMAHQGIPDRTGKPSILHPLRVMSSLAKFECGKPMSEELENILIAAVLHDSVEDTNMTVDMISIYFGKVVADAVDALTRRKGIEKEIYVEYVKRCCKNKIARIVKEADLKDNLSRDDLSPEEKDGMCKRRYLPALAYIYSLQESEKSGR